MSEHRASPEGARTSGRFRTFASDNNSSVDPRVMGYLAEINEGHQPGYGDDPVTEQAQRLFAETFGEDALTVFVPTGTGANVLGISLLLRPGDAVVATTVSHVSEEESGALTALSGAQIFTVNHEMGKLSLGELTDDLARRRRRGAHSALPRVVTIANATEYGTCYGNEEVRELAAYCHAEGMYLHMDGCRLANAAVALGQGLRESSRDLGVDVLSFGGAKNGLMSAEAVVVFRSPGLDLRRLQKRAAQLVSKSRFVSGQFVPYMSEAIWRTNASKANALAKKLASGMQRCLGGQAVTRPVDTNQVFCLLAPEVKEGLREAGHRFIDWGDGETRLVPGWDNEESDVDDFLAVLARSAAGGEDRR